MPEASCCEVRTDVPPTATPSVTAAGHVVETSRRTMSPASEPGFVQPSVTWPTIEVSAWRFVTGWGAVTVS